MKKAIGRGLVCLFLLGGVVLLINVWAQAPKEAKIVFVTNRDGNFEIYVMDVDGKNQKNITNHPLDDLNPDWSPDGKKIAFERSEGVLADIYVMEVDEMFRDNDQCFPGEIPEDLPKITFLMAVEKASGEDFTIITDAKQIEGIYVMVTVPPYISKPKPAWVILHHGAPPRRRSGAIIPIDARTVVNNVIDATTGAWLMGGQSGGTEDDYQRYMK